MGESLEGPNDRPAGDREACLRRTRPDPTVPTDTAGKRTAGWGTRMPPRGCLVSRETGGWEADPRRCRTGQACWTGRPADLAARNRPVAHGKRPTGVVGSVQPRRTVLEDVCW